MKLAVLMDPLTSLKQELDTSLAFLRRAASMGLECFYFTPKDLFCRNETASAHCYTIEGLHSNQLQSVSLGVYPLHEFDCILMRLNPPVNQEYIYATYALELAERRGVIVANKPQSLRDVNEKMFSLQFPQCIAPTLVTPNMQLLHDFWEEHEQVVCKPLDGMGGKSVFFMGKGDKNARVILETLTHNGQNTIMAQRYIPGIATTGDKRILLVNGTPEPYALARFPGAGEFRGNLAAGGSGQVVPITERDVWICEQIGAVLREKSLLFVGIDVIGDYLTEINVTSPTCVVEIERESGLDICGAFLNTLV